MKIEQISTNSYRVRKTYKKRLYIVYFDHKPTEREVLSAVSERLTSNDSKGTKGSFEEYANKYIESKSNILSPSTLGGYKKILRNISDTFKKKNLYSIEQIDIQNEVNRYALDRAPKSVRNLHGFISAVLSVFRPNMTITTSLPQKKKFDRNLPTTEEVKKILEASKGTPYHIPFQLAVLGLRRSEICAATPEDIHGNYLTINKARIYDEDNHLMTRDNTKTVESTREVYLPDDLVKEIEQAGTIYDLTPPTLVLALHEFQDNLGIERFRLHDLRAYYVSYAHSIGIPDVYIMKSGGWKTDYVMKSVYRNALKDQEKEMQMKYIDGMFHMNDHSDD